MRRIWAAVVGIAPWLVVSCQEGHDSTSRNLSGTGAVGGARAAGVGGAPADGGSGGAGAAAAGGATTSARGCSDLFDPSGLVDYGFDISADEWAKMDYEFRNRAALKAAGVDFKTYHPIVFHHGSETVSDAMVRLKGQSSWAQAVRDDGDKAKMQFVVSFEEVDPAAKFHGVSKIVLDMPNNDQTFMQERLGYATMAEIFGLPAPCANSARVTINGQYYGVYVNEEHIGHGYIKRVFPDASTGDLFEGGQTPKTNELMPSTDKLKAFWAAHDITATASVVDLEASVSEWAAESMLNDGDGYYGGGHNFYIYDYPGAGYRWLIDDADATFAWLGRSDTNPIWRSDTNPIYWWAGRVTTQEAGQHYLIVMADQTWRAKYVDALRTLLARWDVARLQGWIAAMRQEVVDRPAYIARFLSCEDGSGDHADGDCDGFAWCNDCDDGNAAVNPGAAEICGNGIDDNCNRLADAQEACQ